MSLIPANKDGDNMTTPSKMMYLAGSKLVLGLILACGLVQGAASQSVAPVKEATLLIGFAPGGGIDTTGRIVAGAVSDATGVPIVVLNKPGAGGNVAHQSLAASGPYDGSTIILSSVGSLTVSPHMTRLGYDPKTDFAPISMGVKFPNVLVIPASLNIKSLDEFIRYAQDNPGKVNFASSGVGSASHMAGELLNDRAGIAMVHVPYKGGAPAMNDLLTGRVDAYFATPSSSRPHIQSGKLVAIATSGAERSSQFPDLPAISERYPGFNATNWYAFMAPAATPAATVQWWNEQINKALNSAAVKEKLAKAGLEPTPSTQKELGQTIALEFDTWGRIIKERGITLAK